MIIIGVLVERWPIGLSARTAASVLAGRDRGETARIDPPKSLRSTMPTPTPSARSRSVQMTVRHRGVERWEQQTLVGRTSSVDVPGDRSGHPIERPMHPDRSGHGRRRPPPRSPGRGRSCGRRTPSSPAPTVRGSRCADGPSRPGREPAAPAARCRYARPVSSTTTFSLTATVSPAEPSRGARATTGRARPPHEANAWVPGSAGTRRRPPARLQTSAPSRASSTARASWDMLPLFNMFIITIDYSPPPTNSL